MDTLRKHCTPNATMQGTLATLTHIAMVSECPYPATCSIAMKFKWDSSLPLQSTTPVYYSTSQMRTQPEGLDFNSQLAYGICDWWCCQMTCCLCKDSIGPRCSCLLDKINSLKSKFLLLSLLRLNDNLRNVAMFILDNDCYCKNKSLMKILTIFMS